MFCRYCGSELREESRFCNHCGKSVVKREYKQSPKTGSKTPVVMIIAITLAFILFVIPVVLYSLSATISGTPNILDKGNITETKTDRTETKTAHNALERENTSNGITPQWVNKGSIDDINPGRLSDYLNDNEKKVYEMEIEYFTGHDKDSSIPMEGYWNPTLEDWKKIEFAVENDLSNCGYILTYVSTMYYPDEKVVKIEERLDPEQDLKEVKPVIAEVAKHLKGTDSEKVRQIHDYICENVEYDDKSDKIFTTYGALIDHKAVCNGYSAAFESICSEAGIPCYQIWGEAGGGRHAWNIVKLEDGNWYEVDVMWDDIDPTNPYYYFCIPTSKMSESHKRSGMGGFEEIIPVTQE